jgi:hypothetical protein
MHGCEIAGAQQARELDGIATIGITRCSGRSGVSRPVAESRKGQGVRRHIQGRRASR